MLSGIIKPKHTLDSFIIYVHIHYIYIVPYVHYIVKMKETGTKYLILIQLDIEFISIVVLFAKKEIFNITLVFQGNIVIELRCYKFNENASEFVIFVLSGKLQLLIKLTDVSLV